MKRVRKMKPVLKNSDNSNASSEIPAGTRVLIIDGNQESLHQSEMTLKECGYIVEKCKQGKEALKLLNEGRRKFDIILTERCLPDINEFELLGTLSKITDLPTVIVMSESRNHNTIKDCIKYGAYGYLVKPIQRKELEFLWIQAFSQSISMRNEVPQTDVMKKIRKVWSPRETQEFYNAYEEAKKRGDRPTPKLMIEILNRKGLEDLTQKEVASKLQKLRRKIGEVGTSSNQLNLSTQHQQALAAGSTSLGPRMITPNFQNVQVNVDHSITDKMTQTLSSHEQPCNEMSNIIQDQATAVNIAGIEQTCIPPRKSSDCDLYEGYRRMTDFKDLSVGQPVLPYIPNISQDHAAAENVAGIEQTSFSLLESSDCDLFEGYRRMTNTNDLSVGQSVLHPNIIQDQAVAENVAGIEQTCFPRSELSNYDYFEDDSFMPNINTSLQSSYQDCDIDTDYTPLCEVHNPELNEGIPSVTFEDSTGEANNIQEQDVGNGLTHFSRPECFAYDDSMSFL